MKRYLGIDTSNYTTSVAVATENGISVNLKQILTVENGERGLRQRDAVFAHVVNLPQLLEKALQDNAPLTAVGYSASPRDAEGSYMPCFLVGETTARAIAAANHIPVYRFSHQAGHLMAAVFSSGNLALLQQDFIAFHVSGGTTEMLFITPKEETGTFSIQTLGGTLDLNAGQAIDRIGVLLGFSFPCGRELERCAMQFCGTIPPIRVCVNGFTCNLSGIENQAKAKLESGTPIPEIAAYTLQFVQTTLEKMAQNALEQYPNTPLLFAGGVMSNQIIRAALEKKFPCFFAEPAFSCDNAAGIALLAQKKEVSYARKNNFNGNASQ